MGEKLVSGPYFVNYSYDYNFVCMNERQYCVIQNDILHRQIESSVQELL